MSFQQFFSIRQNPGSRTNQLQMRDLIISQSIVTCPWAGGGGLETKKVTNHIYNETHHCWSSKGQDRKFIEDINIGDIIVIPFKDIKYCIVARIKSDPIYNYDTGLFYVNINGERKILHNGEIQYLPVVRKIEIIYDEYILPDKRILGRQTLSCIKNSDLIADLIIKTLYQN